MKIVECGLAPPSLPLSKGELEGVSSVRRDPPRSPLIEGGRRKKGGSWRGFLRFGETPLDPPSSRGEEERKGGVGGGFFGSERPPSIPPHRGGKTTGPDRDFVSSPRPF